MFRSTFSCNALHNIVVVTTSAVAIKTLSSPSFVYSSGSKSTEDSEFLNATTKYQHKSLLSYSNSSLKQPKAKREAKLKDMVLIGGTMHPALTEEIASILNVPLADTNITRFADGECAIRVMSEVRGRSVYIIQPCGEDTSDSIMELLLSISTVKRAGCKSVTAVIPYFPFKHYRRGMPKSKKLHSKFLVSGPTGV